MHAALGPLAQEGGGEVEGVSEDEDQVGGKGMLAGSYMAMAVLKLASGAVSWADHVSLLLC